MSEIVLVLVASFLSQNVCFLVAFCHKQMNNCVIGRPLLSPAYEIMRLWSLLI